tara:strand:- start:635 stop:793 length:159 start_codon:yes stop_codon:yes gene_type:complete
MSIAYCRPIKARIWNFLSVRTPALWRGKAIDAGGEFFEKFDQKFCKTFVGAR